MERNGTWFGVVDDNFRLLAILELTEEELDIWWFYKWCMLLLRTTLQVQHLRRMKICKEGAHQPDNCH